MNELVRTDTANQFLEVAAETTTEIGTLLKFIKGQYFVGDDKIPTGREFLAHVGKLARGWVRFQDGKVTEQKIGQIADGFRAPRRESLGDTDQTRWEKDLGGRPRDPWCHQWYLPLEDAESGEVYIFVTGSRGGSGAIGALCAIFARNIRNGTPIIKINVSSYRHKEFGRIEVPEFPVVAWRKEDGADDAPQAVPSIKDEMNDEIPF